MATTVAVWAVVVSSSLIFLPGIDAGRVVALGLVAVAIWLSRDQESLRALTADRVFVAIVAVGFVIAGILFAADLLHSEPKFAEGDDVRMVQLIVVFVAGRALFAVSRPEFAARWVGWSVSVTIIGVLGVMFTRSGINPVSVVTRAVSEARFGPILFAFRVIHEDVNELAATATIRHFEVRAMVVASLLGIAMLTAHSRRSSWRLTLSSFVLAAAMAFLTFSRGNVLAVAVAVLPALAWWLRRVDVRWRVAVVGSLVAVAVGLLQVGVVRDAVGDGSNRSSEVRSARLEQSFELLDDAAWSGVAKFLPDGTRLRSPHNMVLDLWLGGGVAAAACGAVLVVLAFVLTIRTGARVLRADRLEEVLVSSALFGLFVVVVIRMLTGGGGLMDPATWFGFGAALAIRTGLDGAFAQPEPSTAASPPK